MACKWKSQTRLELSQHLLALLWREAKHGDPSVEVVHGRRAVLSHVLRPDSRQARTTQAHRR